MANIDTASVQKIFNAAKRKRKPNVQFNASADGLGARLEAAEGGTFCHPPTLSARPSRIAPAQAARLSARDLNVSLCAINVPFIWRRRGVETRIISGNRIAVSDQTLFRPPECPILVH
jgi:hypothetical protein